MTTTLISGATGFLGFALAVRILNEDENLVCLVRKESAGSTRAKILRERGAVLLEFENPSHLPEILAPYSPDRVFHLATKYIKNETSLDIASMVDANIVFGTYLLESVSKHHPIFVSTQSYFQFASLEGGPISLYAAFKSAFSDICRYYAESGRISLREVVLYDTYGPSDSRPKLIPGLLSAMRNQSQIRLGNPDSEINLLFVEDAVEALLLSASQDTPTRAQVKSQHTITLIRLVNEIEAQTGKKLVVEFNSAAPVEKRHLSVQHYPAPNNWVEKISLTEGIRRTFTNSSNPFV